MEDFLIVKQSGTYSRHTENYIHSKVKWQSDYQKKIYQRNINVEIGGYNFTYNLEIDKEINHAANRNYKIFNTKNGNYRTEILSNLPIQFEIFKIAGHEYFIELESNTKKSVFQYHIYNYGYQIKWLNYLNQLRGNYLIELPKGIGKGIIRDASKLNINGIDNLAQLTEDIFKKCYEFHSIEYFPKNVRNDAISLLNKSSAIFELV